jgi:hypothetical protein
MRTSFIPLILLGVGAAVLGRPKTDRVKPPNEELQEFLKMELQGARLTPEGRSKTAHLLVQPSIAPPDTIDVVSDNFEVHETPATEGSVKLDLYFPYFYGWLDSALRFKAALHVAPGNGLIREGINAEYVLVLTNKHGELEPDRQEGREIRRAQEWRIENAPSFVTINLDTAIRYVSEMREKTTDPTVKKNADETLANLKKLH